MTPLRGPRRRKPAVPAGQSSNPSVFHLASGLLPAARLAHSSSSAGTFGTCPPLPAFLASSQACRAPKYYSLAFPCARATPSESPLRAPYSGRAMSRYRVCLDLDSRPPLLRWPTSADLWLHALAGASSLRCLGARVEDRRAVRYGPPRRPSPRLGFVTYLLAFAGLGQLLIFIYLRL